MTNKKTDQQQKAKEGPGCHCRECICSLLAKLCLTLCHPMKGSKQGFPVHHQLPKLACSNSCPLSCDAIQPSHPLPSPSLLQPTIFPSIKVSSSESVLRIRWPKDWSFSFSISPSSEYSGLISLKMDWYLMLLFLMDSDCSHRISSF